MVDSKSPDGSAHPSTSTQPSPSPSEGAGAGAVASTGSASVTAVRESPTSDGDRALVVGRVGEHGLAILRKRSADAPLEAGIVHPLREGQAIHGEVVKLTPRADEPLICDVDVHIDARANARPGTNVLAGTGGDGAPAARKGPAKVASPRFRDGWDRVFGGRSGSDLPN